VRCKQRRPRSTSRACMRRVHAHSLLSALDFRVSLLLQQLLMAAYLMMQFLPASPNRPHASSLASAPLLCARPAEAVCCCPLLLRSRPSPSVRSCAATDSRHRPASPQQQLGLLLYVSTGSLCSTHRATVRTSVGSLLQPLLPSLRCRASLMTQVSQPVATGSAAGAHACAVALRVSLFSLRLSAVARHCCDLRALFGFIRPLPFSALARREYSPQHHPSPSIAMRPSLRWWCMHSRRTICGCPSCSPLLPRRSIPGSCDFGRSSCSSY